MRKDELVCCPRCGESDCKDIYHPPSPEKGTRVIVMREVDEERQRQNEKWRGNSLHTVNDPLLALAVLGEEFGEVAEAVVEWSAAKGDPECAGTWMAHYRHELIQVAAVAVAAVQAFDLMGPPDAEAD